MAKINETNENKVKKYKILGRYKVSGFKWGEIGNSSIIHKQTICDFIDNNEKFKRNLKGRKLLGAITHGPRLLMNPLTQQGDVLLNNGKEAFITTELWYDDTGVYGKIEIIDNEEGRRLKSDLDAGVGLQPSIGIQIDPQRTVVDKNGISTVHVINIYGFDLTTTPAYNTYIMPEDLRVYSEQLYNSISNYRGENSVNLFFSSSFMNSDIIKKSEEKLDEKNKIIEITEDEFNDESELCADSYFAAIVQPMQYLNEKTMLFKKFFPMRIEALRKLLKSISPMEAKNRRVAIINYIKEPLLESINNIVSDKSRINLRIYFGIDRYLKNPQILNNLQRTINKIKIELKQNFIRKEQQIDINNLLATIIEDLFVYITKDSKPEIQNLFKEIYNRK